MTKRTLNPLLHGAWANIRAKRHDLESKARDDINREMERYSEELAVAVYRATKLDGHSIAELCRATGASRPTVYSLIERGEGLQGGGGALSSLTGTVHPYDKYFSRVGLSVQVHWPAFMPWESDHGKKWAPAKPVDLNLTVRHTGIEWEMENPAEDYVDRTESEMTLINEKQLRVGGYQSVLLDALDEWSGK